MKKNEFYRIRITFLLFIIPLFGSGTRKEGGFGIKIGQEMAEKELLVKKRDSEQVCIWLDKKGRRLEAIFNFAVLRLGKL